MTVPAARLIVKNLTRVRKDLEKADKARVKAAETALKVEGFRLSGLMKRELRANTVGGRSLVPLSEIARRYYGRTRSKNKALGALLKAIRYRATRAGGRFNVEVGFVDPGRGKMLSKSWKRIAQRLQEGFTETVDTQKRLGLIRRGARMLTKSGRGQKAQKYFFLRKATKTFSTPARPIVDPFWDAHRNQAQRNIIANWERKLRGERI